MPREKDILKEARDFLNRPNYTLISYEARQLLKALADEVERLRAEQGRAFNQGYELADRK